ncbi:hypothetical protein [Bradyrhizobium sp. USDA 4350]
MALSERDANDPAMVAICADVSAAMIAIAAKYGVGETQLRNCEGQANIAVDKMVAVILRAKRADAAPMPSFEEALCDPVKARRLFDASKGGNVRGITENHRRELVLVLIGGN